MQSGKMLLTATEGPYYHAFGSFFITFSGSYKCDKKGICKFNGKWDFEDEYDWHNGLTATIAGTVIKDDWAILVETYGHAAKFHEYGTWNGTVEIDCCNNQSTAGGGR